MMTDIFCAQIQIIFICILRCHHNYKSRQVTDKTVATFQILRPFVCCCCQITADPRCVTRTCPQNLVHKKLIIQRDQSRANTLEMCFFVRLIRQTLKKQYQLIKIMGTGDFFYFFLFMCLFVGCTIGLTCLNSRNTTLPFYSSVWY